MKVGIITFTVNNFGAQLQAYALQNALEDLGYDAEICDVMIEPASMRIRRIVKVKELVSGLFSRDCLMTTRRLLKKLRRRNTLLKENSAGFLNFKNVYLKKSKEYTANELRNGLTKYDCYITGSDQVFNYTMSSILDIYFLCFTNQKKISYAASFGVSHIPNCFKKKYVKYLKGLDAISIREEQGVKIAESLISRQIDLVVDPTFLLSKEKWNLISDYSLCTPHKYIFVYDLIESDYLTKYVFYLSQKLNAEIIYASGKTPQQFIALITNALHVVTTSFHGTALSINLGTNFTTIYRRSKKSNSRMVDLCRRYDMQDHLLYEGEIFKGIPSMDKSMYSLALLKDIHSSISFLTNNLHI